jgi:hypothetical protein
MDAIFTVKTLINKRREHGMETWLLFLDLVKAFDKVPRELLWLVLARYGVPPKLIRLLKLLHCKVDVQFEVNGVVRNFWSCIGVKQGDVLGPELFVIFMAAVMETWRMVSTHKLCVVRSKFDFQLTGRKENAKGVDVSVPDSEYADDTGMPFCSREDLVENTPLLVQHFKLWGMEVHVGFEDKESKSEVLFCAAPPHCYQDPSTCDGADLSHVRWADGTHMPVVLQFKYLGSIVASNCKDGADVDARIGAATKAFGMLRKGVFSSQAVSSGAKHIVYLVVVMSILLYGSECWCLTEASMDKLRCFHARCVRSMNRVTLKHCFNHRISTASLLDKMNLESIDTYVKCRQLRWLGHVGRMPFERLPRKMLSSWCATKRPRGAPQMTYGRTIGKALAHFHIDPDLWPKLSSCRFSWRELISGSKDKYQRNSNGSSAAAAKQQQQPAPKQQPLHSATQCVRISSRCGRTIRIPARYL